jgi:hypothetical protein
MVKRLSLREAINRLKREAINLVPFLIFNLKEVEEAQEGVSFS